MILVDTDVMIDIFREYSPAIVWLHSLGNEEINLPGFVAMELIQGCRNKVELEKIERELELSSLRSQLECWSARRDKARTQAPIVSFNLPALAG